MHKAQNVMNRICKYCKERPAVTGILSWYTVALLFILGGGEVSSTCCEDCAGGRNFLALLFSAVAAIAIFVLVVIIW